MDKMYKAEASDMLQMIFENFNDHQLHTVIYFNTHIDEACLKKSLDKSLELFPLINCRFVEGFFKAHWEECPTESDNIMEIIKSENANKTIEKLITRKTEEFRGPQMKVFLVREKDKDSLCIVINHMLCDAGGFKHYLYSLSQIYSQLKDKKTLELKETMGSRSLNQIFNKFSLSQKAKILFSSSKLGEYDSGNGFNLEGDNNNPFIVLHKLPKEKFLKIKVYAKQKGVTINDIMLAAYIRTLNKLLKCDGFPIPCAVDLRKYIEGRKAEGICNLVSNIVCYVDNAGTSFEETLFKVKAAMDAEKESSSPLKAMLLLQTAFRFLPYKISKTVVTKTFKNPPIAMTNIGLIDKKKLFFQGAAIKDAYMNGSIKYKQYFQLAITTFDDVPTLSINLFGSEGDKALVKQFFKIFDNELEFIG